MKSINTFSASPMDIASIQSIVREVWPVAYKEMITKEQIDYMLKMMYSDESLLRQMTLEECEFILALDDTGAVVGFASYGEIKAHVFKLHKLYVYSNQQGKGTGKMLLDEVCVKSIEQGGTSIELQVNKKNTARKFYENNGFSLKHEAIFEIGNGFVMDDFVLERRL